MNTSDLAFIKLTTNGYPLELRHSKEIFYGIFADYVNDSKENNFVAEVTSEGVRVHAGMRTEICRFEYVDDRVAILSKISEDSESSTGEFDADVEIQILGHACLGILYFCDLYALGTGQDVKFAAAKIKKVTATKKPIDNNTKYDIWPV
tara:strand:+ start:935 stop:1381 length:447 start_codon:yes stop_codon:yes gene_type:complete